jgi:hypothetical protein
MSISIGIPNTVGNLNTYCQQYVSQDNIKLKCLAINDVVQNILYQWLADKSFYLKTKKKFDLLAVVKPSSPTVVITILMFFSANEIT